ncbi:hypothetical protein NDU88_007206 [Pleurodeles waltl]|uniref:Uncharacterized protein n=1 Tax=Pleurodeles waltl TaxID=8319 RepID=A0AAV7N6B4_PLEWA|nr:hypothetical protein NDU88_007206 [Pleurodeles waltl]
MFLSPRRAPYGRVGPLVLFRQPLRAHHEAASAPGYHPHSPGVAWTLVVDLPLSRWPPCASSPRSRILPLQWARHPKVRRHTVDSAWQTLLFWRVSPSETRASAFSVPESGRLGQCLRRCSQDGLQLEGPGRSSPLWLLTP